MKKIMRFAARYIIIAETISNYTHEIFEWVRAHIAFVHKSDAQ